MPTSGGRGSGHSGGYLTDWRENLPDKSKLLDDGNPSLARSFLFEVDDVEIGIFKAVKGLEMTIAVHDIVEGGQNAYVHKAVGRTTWSNIVFSRGMTSSDALFKWISESSGVGYAGKQNKTTRHTGAITALDTVGKRLRSWTILAAYPVKWRGPEFSADSMSVLEEELEIAHHGFTSDTHKT